MPSLIALTPAGATLLAAGVAAVASILTTVVFRYFVDDRLMRRKAETEYRYEQRKALRLVLGRYEGPLVDAAESLHYRMIKLYSPSDMERLDVGGHYPAGDYFYRSTVFRFIALFRLVVALEREALYLDPRISEERDLLTLRYAKALRWTMTDRGLIPGAKETDHFHGDSFRALCDIPVAEDERFDYGFYEQHVVGNQAYEPVFAFFDGLARAKTPERWDRLVAMHLLLMALMCTIAFDPMHQIAGRELIKAAGTMHDPAVRRRVAEWLIPEMKLTSDAQAQRVIAAVRVYEP